MGLPLAVAFAEAGEQVIGVDVDHARVTALSDGRSPIEDISDERLAVRARRPATSRPAPVELHEAEAILVCVPTPLTRTASPTSGRCSPPTRALATSSGATR